MKKEPKLKFQSFKELLDLKKISTKTHSQLEGFENIMFANNSPNQLQELDPAEKNEFLGKRASKIDLKIDPIPPKGEMIDDKLSKKLKKLNLPHKVQKSVMNKFNIPKTKPNLFTTKALSTSGFDADVVSAAKRVFINQAPITINVIQNKFRNQSSGIKSSRLITSPPNEASQQQLINLNDDVGLPRKEE